MIGANQPEPDADRAVRSAKARLRKQVLDRRTRAVTHTDDERQITVHLLDLVTTHRPRAVAAHIGMTGEAPTYGFVRSCPVAVWLPVVRPDRTMGWARFTEDAELTRHPWGMVQPRGLGLDDLPSEIDMIVMPALAVDRHGHRLGRGGGYYDRALEPLGQPRPMLVAVIPDADLLSAVPHEPHDVRVDVVVTPEQTLWCEDTP